MKMQSLGAAFFYAPAPEYGCSFSSLFWRISSQDLTLRKKMTFFLDFKSKSAYLFA